MNVEEGLLGVIDRVSRSETYVAFLQTEVPFDELSFEERMVLDAYHTRELDVLNNSDGLVEQSSNVENIIQKGVAPEEQEEMFHRFGQNGIVEVLHPEIVNHVTPFRVLTTDEPSEIEAIANVLRESLGPNFTAGVRYHISIKTKEPNSSTSPAPSTNGRYDREDLNIYRNQRRIRSQEARSRRGDNPGWRYGTTASGDKTRLKLVSASEIRSEEHDEVKMEWQTKRRYEKAIGGHSQEREIQASIEYPIMERRKNGDGTSLPNPRKNRDHAFTIMEKTQNGGFDGMVVMALLYAAANQRANYQTK